VRFQLDLQSALDEGRRKGPKKSGKTKTKAPEKKE
jgi:hypothetical protein